MRPIGVSRLNAERLERTAGFFSGIGKRVEAEWGRTSHDAHELPRIAERVLADDPPHEHVNGDDVIQWGLVSREGLRSKSQIFGEPPIRIFESERCYIEVLFWLDGTTQIHEHAFDGAFAVLEGSSIHSTYRFTEAQRPFTGVLIGELAHQHSELLAKGAVRAIRSGNSFIHALFHLERPSLSVVVRNKSTGAGPQYGYSPPHVGYDSANLDAWTARALACVGVARLTNHHDAADIVQLAVQNADGLGALRLLQAISTWTIDDKARPSSRGKHGTGSDDHQVVRSMRDAAIAGVREKFGEFAGPILRSCEEYARSHAVCVLRKRIYDPEHRFFLALLLNVPSRQRTLELVRDTFPDSDPVTKVLGWVRELTDASNPLAGYVLGTDSLRLVECLVRGQSLDQIVNALGKAHGRTIEPAEIREVERMLTALREVGLLRPLFLEGA